MTYTPTQFEELVNRFENVMFDVMSRQIDLHNEIDDLLDVTGLVDEKNDEQKL